MDPAVHGNLPGVLSLLEEHGLPPDGLEDHIGTALVARKGERVVGSAALELYGSGALLRSLAVSKDRRGERLGQSLARECGAARAYLLTEAADGFFPRVIVADLIGDGA